jgi:hypothetical protein
VYLSLIKSFPFLAVPKLVQLTPELVRPLSLFLSSAAGRYPGANPGKEKNAHYRAKYPQAK